MSLTRFYLTITSTPKDTIMNCQQDSYSSILNLKTNTLLLLQYVWWTTPSGTNISVIFAEA